MDAVLGRLLVVLRRVEMRIPIFVGKVSSGRHCRELIGSGVAFGGGFWGRVSTTCEGDGWYLDDDGQS